MAKPASYDITGVSGDTWSQTFTIKSRIPNPSNPTQLIDGDPIDLTGASVLAQIRAKAGDSAVLASFTVTNTLGPDGQINLLLLPAATQALTTGVWDMQITWPPVDGADPVIQTVIAGKVTFSMDVSRAG